MRNKPSGADDERAKTTAELDARDQTAVLRHVLSLHPETLTLDELVREMIGVSSPRPSERDAVERAVRDLAAAGLLHEEGSRVFPTRAAVAFHDLYEA
ncbi:MAG TPA: hypothetical protein VFT79_04660 [Solirubrobacterales bacterium]|nr:hypothetical protein [Solirubrobacterales bacterium]